MNLCQDNSIKTHNISCEVTSIYKICPMTEVVVLYSSINNYCNIQNKFTFLFENTCRINYSVLFILKFDILDLILDT